MQISNFSGFLLPFSLFLPHTSKSWQADRGGLRTDLLATDHFAGKCVLSQGFLALGCVSTPFRCVLSLSFEPFSREEPCHSPPSVERSLHLCPSGGWPIWFPSTFNLFYFCVC